MIFGQEEDFARYSNNLRAPLLHCKIGDSLSPKPPMPWYRRIFGQDENFSDQVLNTSNFSEGDAYMICNPDQPHSMQLACLERDFSETESQKRVK